MYKHLWVWRNVIVKITYFQNQKKNFWSRPKKKFLLNLWTFQNWKLKNWRLRKKIKSLHSFEFKMIKVIMTKIQWNPNFFQNEILIFMVYIRTHPKELLFAEDLYQYDFLSSNINLIAYITNKCFLKWKVLKIFKNSSHRTHPGGNFIKILSINQNNERLRFYWHKKEADFPPSLFGSVLTR